MLLTYSIKSIYYSLLKRNYIYILKDVYVKISVFSERIAGP